MKKCIKCHIEIPIEDGVLLLRGATFVCKPCYKKEKDKHGHKEKVEVCEFC